MATNPNYELKILYFTTIYERGILCPSHTLGRLKTKTKGEDLVILLPNSSSLPMCSNPAELNYGWFEQTKTS